MITKTFAWAAVLMSATSLSTPALADERAACLDAASKGQTLRDAHQIVEAREQFRICARQGCPGVVQTDCAAWLDAVEKSLPTVVLTAKDRAGGDLLDVKVLVDGRPLVTSLDGKSVAMNPGPHVFHFEAADGSSADQQILVKEGERARWVSVVLVAPGQAPAIPGNPSGVRTAGWVLGGLGILGLGVGAVAGGLAIGDKSSANCNASNICASGPLASARTAAKASDAGLIGGGALLAGGVALLLVSRNGGRDAAVRVSPLVGATGSGLAVGGRW